MILSNPSTHSRHRLAPLAETITLLGVLAVVNVAACADDPGFVSLRPHPTLFITLLILVRYGLAAGIQAAAVSTIVYGGLLVVLAEVPTFLYLLSAPYSTPIVVLVPTTVLLGLLVQRHLDRATASEVERDALERDNATLQGEQAKLRDVNVELAGKVVGAEGTVSTLYRYAKELNVKEVVGIFAGCSKLLEEVIEAEAITIWRLEAGELTLAHRSGVEEGGAAQPDRELLDQYFDAGGVLSLHDVPEADRSSSLPYLAGRLCDGRGGKLVAYLLIEKLPFARYNAETIRLFSMVVEWASTSLSNALAMGATQRGEPGAGVINSEPTRAEELPFEEKTIPELRDPAPARSGGGRPAAPPRLAPAAARGKAGGGLSSLLADAERSLDDLEPRVELADAERDHIESEARAKLASATKENAPLRNLLSEVASYLSESSKKKGEQ